MHSDKEDFSSSFSIDEDIRFVFGIPYNCGEEEVKLSILDKECNFIKEISGKLINNRCGIEHFEFFIKKRQLPPGIYNAYITISIFNEKYRSQGCYDSIIFDLKEKNEKNFQISISDFKFDLPKSKLSGIIYHVFVDRFAKSSSNDAVKMNQSSLNWDLIPEYPEYPGAPMKNDTFWGGTLYGIIDKLDYIKSLGATIIFLSPIFLSPSNHRYDTSDYMTVDPKIGGEEALKELILAADKIGIGIIIDGVFNHTGADSIYFNKYGTFDSVGAYQSKESEYYSWFNFKDFPDDYECWWGIPILPRINPQKPSCRNYFVGYGGVIEKYAKMGILGIRLDVADELSDDFISDIKSKLSMYGDNLLYGEVWEDASNKIAYGKLKTYYLGKELDGVMNYPLREGLLDYVLYDRTDSLRYALVEVFLNAPKRVSYAQMNLLGSHDTMRILTAIGDPLFDGTNSEKRKRRLSREQKNRAIQIQKSLYTIIISLPGIPTVYYGDEAGLEGYSDPFNRMPYPWGKENLDLVSFYKRCGKIRENNPAFHLGSFKLIHLSCEFLLFAREWEGKSFVTLYNNSAHTLTIETEEKFCALISNECKKSVPVLSKSAEIFLIKDLKNLRIKRE